MPKLHRAPPGTTEAAFWESTVLFWWSEQRHSFETCYVSERRPECRLTGKLEAAPFWLTPAFVFFGADWPESFPELSDTCQNFFSASQKSPFVALIKTILAYYTSVTDSENRLQFSWSPCHLDLTDWGSINPQTGAPNKVTCRPTTSGYSWRDLSLSYHDCIHFWTVTRLKENESRR